MKALFVADAHLKDPADENYRMILAFLRRQMETTDEIFFLGDIFAFWAGPRFATFPPFEPFIELVKRLLAGGTAVTWVEGNHDFHLAPYFSDVLGCRVLPEGGPVSLAGLNLFLAHGDQANPADRGYHRLRRLLRGHAGRKLAARLPPSLLWSLAHMGWKLSRRTYSSKSARWHPPELIRRHAAPLFQEGFDAVVTGHFHVPLLENLDGKILLGLGDWINQYSYAVLENGRFELRSASYSELL